MRTLDATKPATRHYAVFEMMNASLREIYVGVRPHAALSASPLRLPANSPVLHWDVQSMNLLRYVAFDMDEDEARAFAASYLKTALPPGWRVLS